MFDMYYIVGLGNPGEEYVLNRHNAGRIVLEFAKKSFEKNPDLKIKIIYPSTFMNDSGKDVVKIIDSPAKLKKLVVVYDDMDLPLGKIKISYDRSAGGHNGLASIIRKLKSQEFVRIRIGVSPHTPSGKTKTPHGEDVVYKFLLGNFKPPELETLKKLSKTVTLAIETIVTESKEKAMSLYN